MNRIHITECHCAFGAQALRHASGRIAVHDERRHILRDVRVYNEIDGNDASRHVLPVRVRRTLARDPGRARSNDFTAAHIVEPTIALGIIHNIEHHAVRINAPEEELPPSRRFNALPAVDGSPLPTTLPRTLERVSFDVINKIFGSLRRGDDIAVLFKMLSERRRVDSVAKHGTSNAAPGGTEAERGANGAERTA